MVTMNPFKPGYGIMPPYLAGRECEQSAISDELEVLANSRGPRPILMIGPRGCGKTVLIEWCREQADKISSNIRIKEIVGSIPDDLAAGLTENSGGGFRPSEASADVRFRNEGDSQAELVDRIAEECAKSPLLLLVDEVARKSPAGMGELLELAQVINRRSNSLLLVFAGTPGTVEVLRVSGATFFDRAKGLNIGLLDSADSKEAICKPLGERKMSIDKAALDRIVEDSQGFPYFLQEWGQALFDEAQRNQRSEILTGDIAATRDEVRKSKEQTYESRYYEWRETDISLLAEVMRLTQERLAQGCLSKADLLQAVGSELEDRGTTSIEAEEFTENILATGCLWKPLGSPHLVSGLPSFIQHVLQRDSEHTRNKISESTKDEAQARSGQLKPRKPDVTNIDASADRKNGAFRRPLFDTHIVVDWSARGKPGPAKPTKDGIWWAVARVDDASVSLPPEYARTRDDALRRLTCLIADELKMNRRVLVGFDFPFGYPKGVAERLTGNASALALWDWLAERIKDEPDNANNRFEVAEKINEAYDSGLGPCWGRPRAWPFPTIPEKESARTVQEPHPRERRVADQRAKGAKTVWQLAYAGSVGSQVLLGLPALKRLIEDPSIAERTAVWPLQTGLEMPNAQAVVAEIYPSLLRKEIEKRRRNDEIQDCAQVRINAEAFARLDVAGNLAPLFRGASWLMPDQRYLIETEEAWILGLGHEQALRRALPSP